MAEIRIPINIDTTSVMASIQRMQELQNQMNGLIESEKTLISETKKGSKEREEGLAKNAEKLKEVSSEMAVISGKGRDMAKNNPLENMTQTAKPLSRQLRDVRQEMQLLAEQGDTSSDRFQELGSRAGDLRGAIGDVADQMVQFERAGEGAFSGVKTGLSSTGFALSNLDFDAARQGIEGMGRSFAGLDIKKMGGEIIGLSKALGGTLVQGVKSMGKVFAQVGKSLLLNPIFLIGAVIALLVVAIVKFSDKIAIFGKIMEGVGAIIGWVTGLLEKFTDWLGLTNNAEQDLANKRAKRLENEEKRIKKESTLKSNQYDREVKLLQAKGDLTEAEKKQIYDLTQAKLRANLEAQQAEYKSIKSQIDALKVKGNLTDEEKTQINELRGAYFELGEGIKNSRNDVKANAIKFNSENDKLEKDALKASEDARKVAFEKEQENARKRNEERKKLKQEAMAFLAKIDEENDVNSLKSEDEKALKVLQNSLEKERVTILKNTQLTADDKKKINDYYDALSLKAQNDFNAKLEADAQVLNSEQMGVLAKFEDDKLALKIDKMQKDSNATLNAQIELSELQQEQALKALENERIELEKEYVKLGLSTVEINDFYLQKRNDLVASHNEDLLKIQQEDAKKQHDLEIEKWANIGKAISEAFSFSDDLYSNFSSKSLSSLTNAFTSINEILDSETATISEKIMGVAGAITALASELINNVSELNKAKLEENLANIENANSAEKDIINEKYANGLITKEEAEKASYEIDLKSYNQQEAVKKKAFESNKKLQIASASVAMLQGMVSAFSGAMSLGPIAGPILGAVLAAAVGTMGAINISKIKAQKYNAGAPPSAGGGGMGGLNLNIPEKAMDMNETGLTSDVSQAKTVETPENQSNTAVNVEISITEIENVQKKVNKYKNNSEI